MLERLLKVVKRRTRVVGDFPNETSASTLATEIALRSGDEWALRLYLTRPKNTCPLRPAKLLAARPLEVGAR
jgi:transposase-like protein